MVTLLPATGYKDRLDIPYKTFADKYFLFLSVNGIQFYLYVTQTAIADGLLVIFEHIECVTCIHPNSDTFSQDVHALHKVERQSEGVFPCCSVYRPRDR